MNMIVHHINSFIDDDVFDLAHLNERGDLAARRVAGGHLDAKGADDEEGLVVHLHEVDVEHHTNEGDEYGAGEDSRVLQEGKRVHAGRRGHLRQLFVFIAVAMVTIKGPGNLYFLNQLVPGLDHRRQKSEFFS